MRYTGFKISNFKGVKDVSLDLARAPGSLVHVLVGLNESGKTTILEAINYFSYGTDPLAPGKLSGVIRPDIHDLIPIAERANFNGRIQISAMLQLDQTDIDGLRQELRAVHGYKVDSINPIFTAEDRHSFKNSNFDGTLRVWFVDIQGRSVGQRNPRRLGAQSNEWGTFTKWISERMPKIWYFPNFLFDFPDRIYLDDSVQDDTHKFYRALLQDVLDSLNNGTNVADHLLARAKSDKKSDERSLSGLLLQMGRSITETVFGSWNQILRRSIHDKEVLLEMQADDEGTDDEKSTFRFVFGTQMDTLRLRIDHSDFDGSSCICC